MPGHHPSSFARYGVALVATLIALTARWLLNPALGDQAPFALPFLAVLVAATYGGFLPAALATGLSVAVVSASWLRPELLGGEATGIVRVGVFITIGLAMGWLASRMHRARYEALIQAQQREAIERQRAEDALRTSEQRLRIALEAARMGTWEWDMQTNRVVWSPGLEALHGLQPGAFPGTFEAYERDIHPDDRQRVLDAINRAVENGGDHHVEYRIVLPNGGMRWVEGRGTLARDASGRPVRMIGVCMDVTERKRAEEAMHESEHRFARFTQHLPGLAWIKDLHGRYVYVNDAAATAFQKTREELYGRTDEEIFPPQVAKQFRNNDRQAAETGGVQAVESLEHADGVVHHSLVSKFAIPGRGGAPAWVGGMAIDITDRLRMEQALRDSDRRKDEFLAVLAHELRNPLAPIHAATQVMRAAGARGAAASGETADPQTQWALDVIERQARLMTRLVDDLMDVSRITRGKMELRRNRVDVIEVVHRVMQSIRPLMESRHHHVTLSLPERPVHLLADAARLEQILGNLLNNAAKYTDAHGQIAVSVRVEDSDTVVIRVRDSGVGMEREFLPHAFDMFAQANRDMGRRRDGLGIGLSLVRTLVEMHGGSITAHSEGPGKGSEFIVRLPTSEAIDDLRLTIEIEKGTRQRAIGMSGASLMLGASMPGASCQSPIVNHQSSIPVPSPLRRILVVDDNIDVAETLAVFLRLDGHHVQVAHDAQAALQHVQCGEGSPEIMFIDIGLPGMDGHELARRIRRQHQEREPASQPDEREPLLIALTGWGQPEDHRRSREAGFDHHLVKPVEPEVLTDIVRDPDRFRRHVEHAGAGELRVSSADG
jgi:PAS domain S-box-containing protein